MCQWLMIWFAVHYVTPWVDVVFPSLFSGMSYFFTRLIISSITVFSTKSISAASSRFYIIVCLDRLPTCLRFLVSIFSEWFRLLQKWLLNFFSLERLDLELVLPKALKPCFLVKFLGDWQDRQHISSQDQFLMRRCTWSWMNIKSIKEATATFWENPS